MAVGAPDYEAVRNRAGFFDLSAYGVVEVRGADRAAFLHNLLTQDIKSLEPGSGAEAALVTPSAKLIADLVVLADADAHWLILQQARIDAVLQTLDRYLITEDVQLSDRRQADRIIAIQGPASGEFLTSACSLTPPGPQPLAHAAAKMGAMAVRVVNAGAIGGTGLLLIVPFDQVGPTLSRLEHDGSRDGVLPVRVQAWEILRIEAGRPWFGVDMDEDTLLPETGLQARAVSYSKGCYVGQEIIARVHTYGQVSRKLLGIQLDGRTVPQPRDPIVAGGQEAGAITSGCFSPRLDRAIALGWVKRPHFEAGTRVTVKRGTEEFAAQLITPPFGAAAG